MKFVPKLLPLTLCVCTHYDLLLFCRFGHESVIEYLVGIPDVKLTYDGRSDGTTILDLAYR